jgi:hypothetical protein
MWWWCGFQVLGFGGCVLEPSVPHLISALQPSLRPKIATFDAVLGIFGCEKK